MLVTPKNSLLVIVLMSSVLLLVVIIAIFLAHKYRQCHSRPYLLSSSFFLFQTIGISSVLLNSILNGQVDAPFDTILTPGHLITGFLTLYCILMYIVEIKLPGKQNLKTLLFTISPVILLSCLLFIVHPSPVQDMQEVLNDVGRPDIFIRLIIILFYVAYPIAVICLPYEWRQCLVSRNIVSYLSVLSCVVSLVFVAGMVCGFFPAIVINYICAIILDALVVYIELKIRIPLTDSIRECESHQEPEETDFDKQRGESILVSPEIWMNPDMTATELVKIMGTNHAYLLAKIKSLGYSNYSDMINRMRVDYICRGLEKGTGENIISLMFEAGFRSRSTASREFKRIVGCTPSEYLTRL